MDDNFSLMKKKLTEQISFHEEGPWIRMTGTSVKIGEESRTVGWCWTIEVAVEECWASINECDTFS